LPRLHASPPVKHEPPVLAPHVKYERVTLLLQAVQASAVVADGRRGGGELVGGKRWDQPLADLLPQQPDLVEGGPAAAGDVGEVDEDLTSGLPLELEPRGTHVEV